MKKYTLFLFLFLNFFCFSQQKKRFVLDWKDASNYTVGNMVYALPTFQFENFEFNPVDGTIFFKSAFKVQGQVDESSLKVIGVTYESVSVAVFKDLSKENIATSIGLKIIGGKARTENYATLVFNPILKEGVQYKRVKTIEVEFGFKSVSTSKNSNQIVNSVLANGDWYKFPITKSGVYKLTKSFLSELGLNTNVDPRLLKIYGNGGRMLPLRNSVPYPNDLEENAIQVFGEEDGSFDNSDYILFYAEGVDQWNDESQTSINLYDTKTYYYVTTSGGNGKRISVQSQPTSDPNLVFTTFQDLKVYETDLNNVGKLGRKWVGENFQINSVQTFDFNFPNLVTSSPINIKVNGVSYSLGGTKFDVKANSQSVGAVVFTAINPSADVAADENIFLGSFNSSSPNVSITLSYDNGGIPTSNGYLDYIQLTATRNLQGYGKQFLFSNQQSATNIGVGQYQISSANGISQVWDITDIYNVSKFENSGQASFSFKANLGELRKYIAVDLSDVYFPAPVSNTRIQNQNLKGTVFNDDLGNFKDVDYLIVTPSFLKNQAEKLANFHRVNSNMNVKVVTLNMIYEEFSSGKQDIGAIRNFIKYIYNNSSDPNDPNTKIKYVNLFGDASYDYKNRIFNNTNIVPVFQYFQRVDTPHGIGSSYTFNFSNYYTYMSDDFYGLMDDNEGTVVSTEKLDVAVGRMLVSSVSQAEEMVNKVIEYHDPKSYGRWRNNVVYVSDDIDKFTDYSLQTDLDELANEVQLQKPFLNVKKIHMDSYVQMTTAGGNRYTKAKEDFLNEIAQGALVLNYFGHGGEEVLAQERIFEKLDAKNLMNQYRYPLFITITCSFTKFDNPQKQSGGEFMYWNPKGGAVSLVATTREIGQGSGELLNTYLAEELFAYGSNEYPTIAQAVAQAKNRAFSSDIRVVFAIGDPALKLAIPRPKIRLTKINDIPITQATDTLKALSYVKLAGEVVDEFDNLQTSYKGDLAVQIFDKELNRTTLGNDGITLNGQLVLMNFRTLGETVFRGNASVNNGLFEFGFIVPKDIRIPVGNGRISFYSKNDAPLVDNTGSDTSIKIGDINTNAVADNLPPKIRLYMNDESFVSGGITNESPFLLAFLEDENGINTASGIGHDIVAILDGDENNPYILNDYYETFPNDYTKGKLRFPFRDLAKGLHTLTFKCWDVYNNFATAEIQFIVVGDEEVSLSNVLNYPNPFVSYTEFWFSHNKPFELLDVQVQILTISGKLVKTINQSIMTEGFLSRGLKWDGRDDFGDKIGKGVYVYKLTVRSSSTGKKAEKIEKLVIL